MVDSQKLFRRLQTWCNGGVYGLLPSPPSLHHATPDLAAAPMRHAAGPRRPGGGCCGDSRSRRPGLPRPAAAHRAAPAGRGAAGLVPIRRQGAAGGQHGQLLRLHRPIPGPGRAVRSYRDQGLVVLGFPSNDFAQETGSNTEIAQFCENTFGVRFPLFAKSHVKGGEACRCTASSPQRPRGRRHGGTSTSTWSAVRARWWEATEVRWNPTAKR